MKAGGMSDYPQHIAFFQPNLMSKLAKATELV